MSGQDLPTTSLFHKKSMFEEPTTESWSFYSPVPIECLDKQPCILGVDEAGRGPVMGSNSLMARKYGLCPELYPSDLQEKAFDYEICWYLIDFIKTPRF